MHAHNCAPRTVCVFTWPVSGLTSGLHPSRSAFPRTFRTSVRSGSDSKHRTRGYGLTRSPLRGQRRITDFPLPDFAVSGLPDECCTIWPRFQAVKQLRWLESSTVSRHSGAVKSEFLSIALDAANAAAEISRAYYASSFTVSTKADLTPVTQADFECEQAIRRIILERFPTHGFFGEETGRTQEDAEYLWLVDPIDGTKAFVRQYPFFSTQIALMHEGQIVLGVSSGTLMDELAWAERGCGAWLNGKRLAVSDIDDPDRAAVSTGNLRSLAKSEAWSSLGKVLARADRTRGYGDFYHYHLLAAGKIEAVVESDVNILDIAALSVIVSEAGGVFTDLNGDSPRLETRSVLAANASLHGHYLEQLSGITGDE